MIRFILPIMLIFMSLNVYSSRATPNGIAQPPPPPTAPVGSGSGLGGLPGLSGLVPAPAPTAPATIAPCKTGDCTQTNPTGIISTGTAKKSSGSSGTKKSTSTNSNSTAASTGAPAVGACAARPAANKGCLGPSGTWAVENCNQTACGNCGGDWINATCAPYRCSSSDSFLLPVDGNPDMCACNDPTHVTIPLSSAHVSECPQSCVTGEKYNTSNHKCECDSAGGFVAGQDADGIDACVKKSDQKTAQAADVAKCLADLQAKVTTCSSSSDSAVKKCDVKSTDSGSSDSNTNTARTVLGGINSYVQLKNQGTGAVQNCQEAALASQTGFYALNSINDTCTSEISSCKSDCQTALDYINSNKDQAYQNCRQQAFQQSAGTDQNTFNMQFDSANKSGFDTQVASLVDATNTSSEKCTGDGQAATNQSQMQQYMGDLNNSVKKANQCACNLTAGTTSAACANQVGPAECLVTPTLAGCPAVSENCLISNSASCLCFRNPASCQNGNNGVNSFATGGPNLPTEGTPGTTTAPVNTPDISNLSDNSNSPVSATADTSGANSPFGSATGGPAGAAGGSGAGAGSPDGTAGAATDDGNKKGIAGFFNSAKAAIGSLIGGGSNSDKNKSYGSGSGKDGDIDPSKWRPKGSLRGLASDNEFGSKSQDIWKTMNNQYKNQSQHDTFIVGDSEK